MAKKRTVKKVPRKKPQKRAGVGCPYCGKCFSSVVNNEPGEDQVYRYRRCLNCGRRFRTEEKRG